MARQPKPTGPEQVAAYIAKLEEPQAAMVAALRKIILSADKEVGEQIKWNAPAFYYTGEMQPFDSKEYKRDIVVMNLHRGNVLLVFPTGEKINDTTGLLEGSYTDGRRLITINDMDEVKAKEKGIKMAIKTWLKTVER